MRAVVFALVALSASACATTPDLTFDDEGGDASTHTTSGSSADAGGAPIQVLDSGVDRGSDAAQPTGGGNESGGNTGADAGGGNAGNDAGTGTHPDSGPPPPPPPPPPQDAGTPPDAGSTCGPAGVDICCPNGVPCVGKKCASRCTECGACAGKICCVPNGNGRAVSCVINAVDCGPGD